MLYLALLVAASLSPNPVAVTSERPASCTIENRPASIAKSVVAEIPAAGQNDGITGTTLVQVDLLSSGAVRSTRVHASSGSPLLDMVALRAARSMTYAAEIRACDSVPGSYVVEFEFQ